MTRIFAALFLALIALAPISGARADDNPTTINAGCGLAVGGAPGASLYSFGTLSTYLTVSTATGPTAAYSCGSAVARSNGGAAMADPTPAPVAGMVYYAINADSSAALKLTAPSGVIKAGSASATTLTLSPGQTALIASDGTNQFVIGGNYSATGGGSGCATTGCTYTGAVLFTGTSTPTAAAGSLSISGLSPLPALTANGEGAVALDSNNGLELKGFGAVADISLGGSAGGQLCEIPHGSQSIQCLGLTLVSSAAVGRATNGTIWNDIVQNTLGSFENGLATYKSGAFFSQTTATATSGITASPMIGGGAGTKTLPAGYLVVGKTIRISVAGIVTTAATPGTVSIAITLGGTVIAQSVAPQTMTAGLTNVPFGFTVLVTCQSTGTSGIVLANTLSLTSAAATAAVGGNLMPNASSSGVTTTVNTTGALAIGVTSTNSVSSGTVWTTENAVLAEEM